MNPPKAVLFFHGNLCDLLVQPQYREEVMEKFAGLGYHMPAEAPPVCQNATRGVDLARHYYGASYAPFPAHFIDTSDDANYQKVANFALRNLYAILNDTPPPACYE